MDNEDLKIKHALMIRELWCRTWAAAVSSSHIQNKASCTEWADGAVAEFNKRFKAIEKS